MQRQTHNPLSSAVAEYGDAQFSPVGQAPTPVIDMHRVLKSGNVPAGVNPGELKGSMLDVANWLPFAAEAYNVSPDVEDYVLVPTLIFATEIPNSNLCAFPYEEMSKWNVGAGCVSYQSWRKKPCVAGSALVNTDRGLIPIRELREAGARLVKTLHGSTRIREWIYNGYGRIHEVVTRHGTSLRVTGNHQFLVLDTDCRLRWVEARCLGVGDRVITSLGSPDEAVGGDLSYAMPVVERIHDDVFYHVSKSGRRTLKPKHQTLRTTRFPTNMTRELARLLGHLAAEGCVRKRSVSYSNTNPDLIRDYVACYEACFGDTPSILRGSNQRSGHGAPSRHKKKKILYCAKTSRLDVGAWLHELGLAPTGCESREVPHAILEASPEHRLQFLRAYVEGDGCLSGGNLQMHSVSEHLIRQLKTLMESVGFACKIGISRPADPATNRRDLWQLVCLQPVEAIDAIGTISSHRARVRGGWRARVSDAKKLRVPFLKKWAIDVVQRHRVGDNMRSVAYRSSDGRILAQGFPISARYTQARLTREQCAELALVLGQLDPEYAERARELAGNVFYDEVRSVRDTGLEERVYDVATDAGEFVANGLVVHNCFVEHANSDPTIARGAIFDASMRPAPEYLGGLHRVVLLTGWDRRRDPALASQLATGRNGFSMGSWVEDYECGVCHASLRSNQGQGCDHIHPKFGPRMKEVGGKLVYRVARGVTGFELSTVKNPAYKSAVAEAIG